MNCLICDAETNRLFQTSHFDLRWCNQCSFGRLAGDFTPEQVSSFYPASYYTHSIAKDESRKPSPLERLLIHSAFKLDGGKDFDPSELPAGKTACDIGCGNGDLLRKLRSAGYSIVGIEPDQRARHIANDVCPTYDGTAEHLPPVGKFDVVLMSHVLEHCIDPIRALTNAKSILANDGVIVIEVPNNAATGFRWFKDAWPWTDIPRHLSFFTERSLRLLLERTGLQVTDVFYTGYTRQFMPKWRAELNLVRAGWPLLLRTMLAPNSAKYDSIRVHARVLS
ncbi:class I SAM-dependent methyltransferase [Bradyrhizobium sp. Tv2a-2]|uniref:class I SAM-dependent methyltransferase n=1 Tax=Bradyrhizobium sp. Tv2a-2 TaxID=113395 RepID=UPI000A05359C|nr:class I SAM-dependent methyltransferase [Bradyrhizobium sp. Tv2a-2]